VSNFKKIDPINDEQWTEFVKRHEDSNMFYLPEWLQILKEQYNYKIFAFCLYNNNGDIIAGIPFCEVKSITMKKKWISLPFSDYVPPLYTNETDLIELLEQTVMYRNKEYPDVRSIEIRHRLPAGTKFNSVENEVLYTLKLDRSREDIFASFKKKSVSQVIQKSLEAGLESEVRYDYEAVEDFYRLHLITRQKLGVPIQPKAFFIKLYDNIIKKKHGFIVLVKSKDGKIIGAGMLIGFKNVISLKYAASDKDYLHLRPNNIMYWRSIQESMDLGYQLYDFGKTEISNTGLRSFKSHWGTDMEMLPYNYYPEAPEANGESLSTKLLFYVIRFSPKFICRLIGELLYKYAA